MKSKTVLKWYVPVDDQPHDIGGGKVLHVDVVNDPRHVVVWTQEPVGDPTPRRQVQVYGTGFSVPDYAEHIGSVVCANGALVWHAFDMTDEGTGQ